LNLLRLFSSVDVAPYYFASSAASSAAFSAASLALAASNSSYLFLLKAFSASITFYLLAS
jgi:hypothetical protein